MTPAAIVATRVTKTYRRFLHKNQFKTLKSALLTRSLLSDLKPEETFTALEDVSFEVPTGSTFGVIGENGSGKSTLLKLLSGISKPTTGTLTVNGRISALIELGAGFHPEISGRENVAINGIMLGLTRRDIEERFDAIVDFAELRPFIDAPVKTYSSGMYMRLGFAVAVHVDPEVLLIDEVLAVGDEAFTQKCLDKISEFRRRGKTILIVSHSLGQVEKMCDEILWLRRGRKADQGDPKRVIMRYLTYVAGGEGAELARAHGPATAVDSGAEPPADGNFPRGRWGTREAQINDVRLLDANGQERHVYVPGECVTVRLSVRSREPLKDYAFGLGLFSADGISIYSTNTELEGYMAERILDGDAHVSFVFDRLDLVEGTYTIDVAVHRRDGRPYDYHRSLYSFRIKSRIKDVGVYRPSHRWLVTGDAGLIPPPPRAEFHLHDDPPPPDASKPEAK